MQKISESLEAIAAAVEKGSQSSEVVTAVNAAMILIQESKKKFGKADEVFLSQLEMELVTWQSKLAVIFKEEAGKKGMAKHARFWAEKLRAIHV